MCKAWHEDPVELNALRVCMAKLTATSSSAGKRPAEADLTPSEKKQRLSVGGMPDIADPVNNVLHQREVFEQEQQSVAVNPEQGRVDGPARQREGAAHVGQRLERAQVERGRRRWRREVRRRRPPVL